IHPMDGDHMGTAPYNEFLLASPAADDKSPDPMEPKALHEMSAKVTNSHPAVFLLFPAKDAGEPKALDKGDGHWVLQYRQDADAAGKKAALGVGLCWSGRRRGGGGWPGPRSRAGSRSARGPAGASAALSPSAWPAPAARSWWRPRAP